jgi:hypothetical protein
LPNPFFKAWVGADSAIGQPQNVSGGLNAGTISASFTSVVATQPSPTPGRGALRPHHRILDPDLSAELEVQNARSAELSSSNASTLMSRSLSPGKEALFSCHVSDSPGAPRFGRHGCPNLRGCFIKNRGVYTPDIGALVAFWMYLEVLYIITVLYLYSASREGINRYRAPGTPGRPCAVPGSPQKRPSTTAYLTG